MDGRLEVHHLAIRTHEVAATATFYKDVLGLIELHRRGTDSVWLALSDATVLMVERRAAGEPAIPAGSMDLIAFRVSDARKAEIRDAVKARGCFDGETAHTVYFRDPDGRRVGVSTHPLASER
jgi:catechol 2,3-dioxygenase-like lactoylglutathione lyase family enzyme